MSNKRPNYWAIVPAAGLGSRMASDRPKQYLLLQDKPILQWTLERLYFSGLTQIVVCLANNDDYWDRLTLPMPIVRVSGGVERCHSVFNGLQILQSQAQPDDWVLVHDAARPCVRVADIQQLMTQLKHHPVGGLLAISVRDTMKRIHSSESLEVMETVNREGLWHALTPQMFRFQTLYEALQRVLKQEELVTDEAQAIEKMGLRPKLVAGHADNIKITHPQDLSLAELYLQQQNQMYAN